MSKVSNVISSDKKYAIVGLGKTGRSCARYMQRTGRSFVMLDTRLNPPGLADFEKDFPGIEIFLGPLSLDVLTSVQEVIVSPGVALSEPVLKQARDAGIEMIGDIQLFLRNCEAPIVAITGSNAKSTVTMLVGNMARRAGVSVAVGGNIGTPVLDLLEDGRPELVVMELSSFQLESLSQLNAQAAVVLNVSEDHMDRYADLQAYHQTKHRIYYGAKNVIFNRSQILTAPLVPAEVAQTSFGLDKPDLMQFGVVEKDGLEYLAYGMAALMPVAEIGMPGRHNIENVLAALALGQAVALPMDAMLAEARAFGGLPHRCQFVTQVNGVDYYNDSKGTNVGATLAALEGLALSGDEKIILIAGGQPKDADFSPLISVVKDSCRALIVIGEAAEEMEQLFASHVSVVHAASMDEAVAKSGQIAQQNDVVLLSPACASFDMFSGFENRGDCFVSAVQAIAGEGC